MNGNNNNTPLTKLFDFIIGKDFSTLTCGYLQQHSQLKNECGNYLFMSSVHCQEIYKFKLYGKMFNAKLHGKFHGTCYNSHIIFGLENYLSKTCYYMFDRRHGKDVWKWKSQTRQFTYTDAFWHNNRLHGKLVMRTLDGVLWRLRYFNKGEEYDESQRSMTMD